MYGFWLAGLGKGWAMRAVTSLSFAAIPRVVKPSLTRSADDLIEARDAADRQADRYTGVMRVGGIVNKAGKAAFATGLVATGLSLVGLPIPLGGALGLVVAGPLLRFAGASITMRGLAGYQKAAVRSAGLSQEIDRGKMGP